MLLQLSPGWAAPQTLAEPSNAPGVAQARNNKSHTADSPVALQIDAGSGFLGAALASACLKETCGNTCSRATQDPKILPGPSTPFEKVLESKLGLELVLRGAQWTNFELPRPSHDLGNKLVVGFPNQASRVSHTDIRSLSCCAQDTRVSAWYGRRGTRLQHACIPYLTAPTLD